MHLGDIGRPFRSEDEVHERACRDRHANGDAAEATVELGQDPAHRGGGAGRGRDNIDRGGPRTAGVLVVAVDQPLVARVRVHRGHERPDRCRRLRRSTFATGARQFVVHEAFETIVCCGRVEVRDG